MDHVATAATVRRIAPSYRLGVTLASAIGTMGGASVLSAVAAQLFLRNSTRGSLRAAMVAVGLLVIVAAFMIGRSQVNRGFPEAFTLVGRARSARAVEVGAFFGLGGWLVLIAGAEAIAASSGIGPLQMLAGGGGIASTGGAFLFAIRLRHSSVLRVHLLKSERDAAGFALLTGPKLTLDPPDERLVSWRLNSEPRSWIRVAGSTGTIMTSGVLLLRKPGESEGASRLVHVGSGCEHGCPAGVRLQPGDAFRVLAGDRDVVLVTDSNGTVDMEPANADSAYRRNVRHGALVEPCERKHGAGRIRTLRHPIPVDRDPDDSTSARVAGFLRSGRWVKRPISAPALADDRYRSLLATRGFHSFVAGLALAVVAVALYQSYPVGWNEIPTFTSPRQQVTYELSRNWADFGRPVQEIEQFERLPPDIARALTPRDAAINGTEIVPKDFPLSVAVFAAVHLVASRLVPLAGPLSAVFTLVVLGLLTFEVTRSRFAAWFAAALFGSTTSFWNTSAALIAIDTLGVGFLLFGILCLARSERDDKLRWYLFGGAAFGLAIASRYTVIALVAGLFIAFVATRPRAWRRFLLVPATAGLIGVPVLLYHRWLYGSPFNTGYHLADQLFTDTANFEGRGLLTVDFARILGHIRIYLARPEIAAIVVVGLIAIVLIATTRKTHRPAVKAIVFGFIPAFVAMLIYHGGQNLWGAREFVVNSSFLKYFLPLFGLLSLFTGWLVARLKPTGRVIAALVAGVVAFTAFQTTWDEPGGVSRVQAAVAGQRARTQVVLDATPADALIISRLASKLLWPQRQVLTATLLRNNADPIPFGSELSIWEVLPDLDRLAEVSVTVAQAGYPLYLLNDGEWLSADEVQVLDGLLADDGLSLVEVSNAGYVLYEVATDRSPGA